MTLLLSGQCIWAASLHHAHLRERRKQTMYQHVDEQDQLRRSKTTSVGDSGDPNSEGTLPMSLQRFLCQNSPALGRIESRNQPAEECL